MSKSTDLLTVLRKNKKHGVFNYDLAKPMFGGLGYRGRISELREEGHNILCVRVSTGVYKYYLIEEEDKPRGIKRLFHAAQH